MVRVYYERLLFNRYLDLDIGNKLFKVKERDYFQFVGQHKLVKF